MNRTLLLLFLTAATVLGQRPGTEQLKNQAMELVEADRKRVQEITDSLFSSISRSKPTAFQAVSFERVWMRIGGWKSIGAGRMRSTISSIT